MLVVDSCCVNIWITLLSSSSCVEVLLAAGAAVDAAASGGQTSLFLACEAGRLDCVRVLLVAGADRSLTATVSRFYASAPSSVLTVTPRH